MSTTFDASSVPQKPKQPKGGFIAAAIVLVLGAVLAIGMVIGSVFALASSINGIEDVAAGSSRIVQLRSGENQVIGAGRTGALATSVTVEVTDGSGRRLPLRSSSSTYSASDDGLEYRTLGVIDVPATGSYTLSVDGPPGTSAGVGRFSIVWFLVLLIGGFVVGGLALLVSVVLVVVTLLRRMQRDREWRAQRLAASAGAPPAVDAAPVPPPPPPPSPPPGN